MKRIFLAFFILIFTRSFAQSDVVLKYGDPAPSFIVTLEANSIQSYVMPYMKRLVLLHFWSSEVITSRNYGRQLNGLAKRYQNVVYKNAEGFEVIAIAVQNNKRTWKDAIAADSLSGFTNGIAPKGYEDEVCKKYGVRSLPTDILIDEGGKIIAVDPKVMDIENILDERKNFQPVKKDVVGSLAQASSKAEVLKFSKLYLFNTYGDSIARTTTNSRGEFTFSNIKLNQDFILKVDNHTDIITSDPVALYMPTGELLLEGKTGNGGFVFYIPARLSYKLTVSERTENPQLSRISIVKNIEFTGNMQGLTAKDEKELNSMISLLQKDPKTSLEFTTNTDSKLADEVAMELTVKQANTLKNYFEKKGIAAARLKAVAKGSDEPRVICSQPNACTENDHKENRRVEFFLHKN